MTALSRPRWRAPFAFAIVAGLSGVLLVGISSWFLGAVALAGLGPAAFAFGFHHPAAIVRLLALVRTGARYGERLTGHTAALADQTAHRTALFQRMAGAAETRAQGWQLARADRLQSFLGDVERVDFERLRATLPLVSAGGATILVCLLTVFVVPFALPAIMLQAALLLPLALCLARAAADRSEMAVAAQRSAGEALGQQLAGLVSLEGSGERPERLAESISHARVGEECAAAARLRLGAADTILAALGPVAAMLVLATVAARGETGDETLPALLTAFSWLALGELWAPIARSAFAHQEASRARFDLSRWEPTAETAPDDRVRSIVLRDVPLRSPTGRPIGGRVSLEARPGVPAALLGPSGCGKSTLLKEIAGWLPWRNGGQASRLPGACHLSLHDTAILDGTFRDNLFSDAADADLWLALDAVELSARVSEAGGLDARVTQSMLSLGEARRIALARALLSDEPVVLLDEPGEHLDAAQAVRILKRVLVRLDERTVLFVTHEPRLAALAATQGTVE